MDAIEIFFAVYGVLLALALARILSSAARLIRHRTRVRIGWTTPLLMLLLLLDICSFVNNASSVMGLADLSLAMVATGVGASGAYLLAAHMVAPDDLADWPDLDAYYDKHKRFVVGCMAAASVLGFEITSVLVKGLAETITARWTGIQAMLDLTYYLLIAVLFFIRNRATNVVMLATLCAVYFVVIGTF
jgi:hypothetical protein